MAESSETAKPNRPPLLPGLKSDVPEGTKAPAAKTAKVEKPSAPEPETAGDEVGGRGGLDPTRYGDWEINGRCVDF